MVREGLRTLVVGKRVLTEDQYTSFEVGIQMILYSYKTNSTADLRYSVSVQYPNLHILQQYVCNITGLCVSVVYYLPTYTPDSVQAGQTECD